VSNQNKTKAIIIDRIMMSRRGAFRKKKIDTQKHTHDWNRTKITNKAVKGCDKQTSRMQSSPRRVSFCDGEQAAGVRRQEDRPATEALQKQKCWVPGYRCPLPSHHRANSLQEPCYINLWCTHAHARAHAHTCTRPPACLPARTYTHTYTHTYTYTQDKQAQVKRA